MTVGVEEEGCGGVLPQRAAVRGDEGARLLEHGKLLGVDRGGHATLLADVNRGVSDIDHVARESLLLVAMMYDDSVVAYDYRT